MRVFRYYEPSDDGRTPIEIIMTEDDILNEYFEYWKNSIIEVKGEDFFNNIKNKKSECITDWQIVTWADEINAN